MKFIHAGDLHIDSPLSGLSAHADAPVEALRTATRSAFVYLIDEAIERKVAFFAFSPATSTTATGPTIRPDTSSSTR